MINKKYFKENNADVLRVQQRERIHNANIKQKEAGELYKYQVKRIL